MEEKMILLTLITEPSCELICLIGKNMVRAEPLTLTCLSNLLLLVINHLLSTSPIDASRHWNANVTTSTIPIKKFIKNAHKNAKDFVTFNVFLI